MIITPLPDVIEPIKVLAQALFVGLRLPEGQIMLGLENYKVPANPGLYIALLYGPDTTVGNNSRYDTDQNGAYYQVQEAAKLHEIILDVMSFDAAARVRQQEVIFAVTSDQAVALMEENSMRFGSTPGTFLPVPSLEETKQLNRWRVSFSVNAIHRKATPVPYYDTLQPLVPVVNA